LKFELQSVPLFFNPHFMLRVRVRVSRYDPSNAPQVDLNPYPKEEASPDNITKIRKITDRGNTCLPTLKQSHYRDEEVNW
jgi:hypothetical protein